MFTIIITFPMYRETNIVHIGYTCLQSNSSFCETDVVEPTIPYSLGLLITNDGYGAARNTKITSGQPEIIENEKGLLISFKIIGAHVDDQPVSPSLTVTFGDIQPHTTRVSRWMMTSTLKGTFSNYSATFENINPLGKEMFRYSE